MAIREIFSKDIDRPMNPVIKVSDQDDEQTIFQELDEYVVTNDIKVDFEILYKSIIEGLSKNKDHNGVWISGDFGSGKSHFLKIVSFLLKNSTILGKKATDYLKLKVSEPTYAMMQALGRREIDTILFDIDSKSKSERSPNAVVDVFALVFNEMLGLSSEYSVSKLERYLISIDLYDSFKSAFMEISNQTWESKRNLPRLVRGKISQALVKCGAYSNQEESDQVANDICMKSQISAEEFAKMVGEYCKERGDRYTLFFLADEVGQFIADDGPMMVRLQSIVEELGIHAKGQAWVIVTSQEDIDAISHNVSSNDFSKIQGRFTTRIKMLSTDVQEVIEKRILEKTLEATDKLGAFYEGSEADIRNRLALDNVRDVILYENSVGFARTYPFIPYQYQMLQTMLTQLRVKSLSGKSFSNAARSMLKIFKDTASKYADKELDFVVPLYGFFDAIAPELDQPTHIVFYRAVQESPSLETFDIDVLKTLFLVKYFDGLTTNINNISALMVSSFNDSRLDLKKNIQGSLERLEQQNFIQRIGDTYVYLTNQEQDINNEIKKETVEPAKVLQKISEVAYNNILGLSSSKYSYERNHQFNINRFVDEEASGNITNYELSVRISTPHDVVPVSMLPVKSIDGVIFRLTDDKDVFNSFNEYLRTKNFINKKRTEVLQQSYRDVLNARESELDKLLEHAQVRLNYALQNAAVYVNGEMVDISDMLSPERRLSDSMNKLIKAVYSKMNYVHGDHSTKNIEDLFKTATVAHFDEASSDVSIAVGDIVQYLAFCSKSKMTVVVKNILDKFTKKPYGFREVDVQWILALMFRHGKIDLFWEGSQYKGHDTNASLVKPLLMTSRNYDKVRVILRESITAVQVNCALGIYNKLFCKTLQNDELMLVKSVNKLAAEMIISIDNYLKNYEITPEYPGKSELIEIKTLLNSIKDLQSPEFYKFTDGHVDELREARSKYDEVVCFFAEGNKRKEIFDRALSVRQSYVKNQNILLEDDHVLYEKIGNLIKPENSKEFHSVVDCCSQLNKRIENAVLAYKGKKLSQLNETVTECESKLDGDVEFISRLHKELSNVYESVKGSDSADEISGLLSGFLFKVDNIINDHKLRIETANNSGTRIVQTPSSQDNIPESKEVEPVIKKKIVMIQTLSVEKSTVSSEDDIDQIVSAFRIKLKDQLDKEGSFDILW